MDGTKLVLHIAKFVKDQYRAGWQNRIEFGQTVKRRRVQIAVKVDDYRIAGSEIGNEFRQRLLK